MGMLILVFLILGVGGGGRFPDAFKGSRADSVVTAGSHAISTVEYRRIFEQQKQRFEEQSKQQLTSEFLIRNGFDQQLLNQMALDQGQSEMLTRIGVTPDPSLIDAQLKQIPAAFDRVTGKFSQTQFEAFLASKGLTPRQVQTDLTDDLAQRHFTYAIAAGFKAPRAYAALSAIAALQNRDISYFVLDPRGVVPPQAPTDAQLTAFMTAHAAQLTRPEMRTVTIARFSAAAMASSVTVSATDIQKEFDFRKDSLSSPETRDIVQIPVKSAGDAAKAAQRLSRGEDPAAIAKAFGAEPVIYSNKPRSAIADGKIAVAAFGLKEGQVSPAQGDLGFAALKVIKVTPARTASLDSVKAKIESDLKAKAAQAKAYDLSQKFDEARQGGSSVADAARKTGVATQVVGPFTAEGLDADGRPDPVINEKIAKAVFAMRAGEESDVQDSGPGEYYALKVEQVAPPALPALAGVRTRLTQAYMQEQMIKALRAKAEALMVEVRKGQTMDAAAASVGAQIVHQPGMQLVQAQQYKALGREFLTIIFSQKPGEVFAAGAPNGVYIARLDAVRPGDVTTTAQFMEAVRQRASQDYLRDLVEAAKAAAKGSVKVAVNLNLARQTMGVDPASIPAAGGKVTGGAK